MNDLPLTDLTPEPGPVAAATASDAPVVPAADTVAGAVADASADIQADSPADISAGMATDSSAEATLNLLQTDDLPVASTAGPPDGPVPPAAQIGRASWRERV